MGTDSVPQSRALQTPHTAGAAGHAMPGRDGLIEMRLRAIDQLFDPVDPSPFGRQDLSQWAAEYIVESVKEMQAPVPRELVIVIDEPCDPGRALVIGKAVRAFFARHAMLRRRSLRRLLRIEIFLYDWWPIVGERRLYDRLSRLEVRVVTAPLTTSLTDSDGPAGGVVSDYRGPIDRAMGE